MARERGQPPTRPGGATKPPQESPATTVNLIKAIQTIEAFVRSASWPERARDVWKHIKEAVFSKAGRDAFDASKDIQELKTQVKGLTDLVKGITKHSTVPALYADILRSKGSPLAGGKPNGQRVQTVPAH